MHFFIRISLYVDDEEVGTIRLARQVYTVESSSSDGLYVGGVPKELLIHDQAGTNLPMQGIIKELALDRQLINLNQKHSFART